MEMTAKDWRSWVQFVLVDGPLPEDVSDADVQLRVATQYEVIERSNCGTCLHADPDSASVPGVVYCTHGWYAGKPMQATARCREWTAKETA